MRLQLLRLLRRLLRLLWRERRGIVLRVSLWLRSVTTKSRPRRHRLEWLRSWLLRWLSKWILAGLAERVPKRPGLSVTRRLRLLLLKAGLLRVEPPWLGLLLKARLLKLQCLRLLLELWWLWHLLRCHMLLGWLFNGIKEVNQIRRVVLLGQTGISGLWSRRRRRGIRIASSPNPYAAGVACRDFRYRARGFAL